MFEREQLRAKLLEGRVEEIKLRRRTLAEAVPVAAPVSTPGELVANLNPDNPDDYLRIINIDKEFREALHNFQDFVKQVIKKRQAQVYRMEPTSFEMDLTDSELELGPPL